MLKNLPAGYLRWHWQKIHNVQSKHWCDLRAMVWWLCSLWWPKSATMMKEAAFPQQYHDSMLREISVDCKQAWSSFCLHTVCPHRGRDGEGHASYSVSLLLSVWNKRRNVSFLSVSLEPDSVQTLLDPSWPCLHRVVQLLSSLHFSVMCQRRNNFYNNIYYLPAFSVI